MQAGWPGGEGAWACPALGGMPFGRGGGKSRAARGAKPVKAKGKGARSGNPAKRARSGGRRVPAANPGDARVR